MSVHLVHSSPPYQFYINLYVITYNTYHFFDTVDQANRTYQAQIMHDLDLKESQADGATVRPYDPPTTRHTNLPVD